MKGTTQENFGGEHFLVSLVTFASSGKPFSFFQIKNWTVPYVPTLFSQLIKNVNVSYKLRPQQEDIFVHLLLALPPNRDTLYV
jgi:hypothetical protein